MRYEDAIYGPAEIKEPVLLELMACNALQRLTGVLQHGVTALLGITPPFSRFDHSVGVMLLVRRLGATLEEQIAALVHDVSHTAFSHVVDFVYNDQQGQSYHEEKKEWWIAQSDIPTVLARHGVAWRDLLDESRFLLLEQDPPALCADRLDYFLRDLVFLGLACDAEIRAAVESLTVKDGRIAVNNLDAARWLAYTFIETDRTSWSSFREVGLYQLTAEAIKASIRNGCIGEQDLWGTDSVLWKKLCSADHDEIRSLVSLITPGTRFTWDEQHPAFRVATKVRSIDPPVVDGADATALSALDPVYGRYRNEYLAAKQGRWPMGVVSPPRILNGVSSTMVD